MSAFPRMSRRTSSQPDLVKAVAMLSGLGDTTAQMARSPSVMRRICASQSDIDKIDDDCKPNEPEDPMRPPTPRKLKRHVIDPLEDRHDKMVLAIKANDLAMTLYTLDGGLDVNHQDVDGWTPLMWSCVEGHQDIYYHLLQRRAKITLRDKKKRTPLILAATYGHRNLVDLILLEDGVDVNEVDEDGVTALIAAARRNHVDVCRLLIEKGADIDHRSNNGATPLMWAICNSAATSSELLLHYDAKTSTRDKLGMTPLLYAARYDGNGETGKILLDHGADINASTTQATSFYSAAKQEIVNIGVHWTPLMIAVHENRFDFIRLLMSRGADVTIKNSEGKTAKNLATSDFVKKLLKK